MCKAIRAGKAVYVHMYVRSATLPLPVYINIADTGYGNSYISYTGNKMIKNQNVLVKKNLQSKR